MRRRLSGLWMVITWPPCDEDFIVGREDFGELSRAAPPEPGFTRRPRLRRSGSTELAEVLALP